MTKAGHVNAERLKSFVERVEKLVEERKAIQGDIKDVFSEAKGVGYDVPTMRKVLALRAMDAADRDEMETLIDVYMHALSAPKRAAVEAMQKGAGTREAARTAGIAVGAASQFRSGVHGIENDEHVHEKQIGEQGDPGSEHIAHDADGIITDTPEQGRPEQQSSIERVAQIEETNASPRAYVDGSPGPDGLAVAATLHAQTEEADHLAVTPVPEGGEGTGTNPEMRNAPGDEGESDGRDGQGARGEGVGRDRGQAVGHAPAEHVVLSGRSSRDHEGAEGSNQGDEALATPPLGAVATAQPEREDDLEIPDFLRRVRQTVTA